MFVFKLTIATLIFYIGFSHNLKEIGYQTSYIDDIDYVNQMPVVEVWFSANTGVDKDIDNLLESLLYPQHQASDMLTQDAYAERFQALCSAYQTLCTKIVFAWDFSSYEKLIYTAAILRIVGQTDKLLGASWLPSVIDALRTISINSEWWQRRWGATRDTIVINTSLIKSFSEFFSVLTHELGHIVDLWVIQWVSQNLDKNFTEFGKVVFTVDDPSITYYNVSWTNESTRSFQSMSHDFCSGYGMTNPFEDFAECFNLYMNHNAYFRYIAQDSDILQQKYNFLANILNGAYLFASPRDVILAQEKISWRRPWDSTRIWQ